ncbi:RagB/SusD family nutrient uptake outer membrane protein [Mucilaginibacter sp. SMC90]|uniref:RagB/SusD family nutrient uptake outer membrane protein n=1 Tax=Mucilaginibacter sp. SMC90 TaxID=2929803 RepID=UPI001FB3F112|nr:RagB/SusD family nutrient uptake outer membrane protein [Mucilaginibacter sp. SMC90]UOE51039.1 RagB/SusD family nutrient uptake outer membrane protein [Mucilaginibacter sp. SMC90]
MKKLFIYTLTLTALFGAGCKKFLNEDVKGALLGADALKSQAGLEAALTGAYAGWQSSFNTGFIHATAIGATMGGDDVTTHKASNKADFREFDQFNVSATNQRTQALYAGCYKAIQGANNIIANYKNTTGDAATITAIAGEAYFVRAVSYYWLVRLYGKIPLITDPNFNESQLTMKSSEAADIYKLIEADLAAAEGMVPDTKRDPGRPNKGSVKAYLADVYLTEAGWPLKQTAKYAQAAAKAKEVIDGKATWGFQLLDTYAQVWANDPTANGTAETVFQISTSKSSGPTTSANYGWSAMPGEEGGWDDFFSELKFYKTFPPGPRKDATFDTLFTQSNGTKVFYAQSQTQHPYYRKYYIKGNEGNYQSSVPESMMRYAYVLTVYAEAEARATGTPDQLAYDCINAIRKRAGLPVLNGLSGAAFANAVVQERAWEFAAERTRWFDLVRLEMVESANANKDPNDLQPIGTITKAKYVFPLPYSETSVNPNL